MKIKGLIIAVGMSAVILSACSYKEMEDKLLNRGVIEDETYVNDVKLQEDTSQDKSQSEVESESSGEGEQNKTVYSIGESIITGFEELRKEITVKNVEIVDNIKDVGIERGELLDTSIVDSEGKVLDSQNQSKNKFVLVTALIKNIDYDYEKYFGDDYMILDSKFGFKSAVVDKDGPFLQEPIYFSEHPPIENNQGTDYYHFKLEIGEEKEVKIGAVVSEDMLNSEELYFVTE